MTIPGRFRHFSVPLLVLVGATVIGVGAAFAFSRTKAAAPIGTGVVVIDTNLGYQSSAAAGTGMVLRSSGVVLTNNHVISGATAIRVVVPNTGHSYRAHVVGYDKTADVAVIQLDGASNLQTISAGDASKLAVGDAVTAVGNAGGTGSLSTARGAVTGLGRAITASDGDGSSAERLTGLIETNAGIEPGDSGGPLLDGAGHVVGMDTAASTGASSPFASATTSDAYAIPIGKALTIVGEIEHGRASSTVHVGGTAFLGIDVESVSADPYNGYGYGYGSQTASGALIANVLSDGPAGSAGLAAGDVITAVDGHAVSSPASLSARLLTEKPGTTVTIAYQDQTGNETSVSVRLGSGPPQ